MNPIVHGMLAWIFAIAVMRELHDRRLVVIAGVVPDIDGYYILYNQELFNTYHHTWGHSYLFAIPLAFVFALLAKQKGKVFLASIGAFTIHVLSDFFSTEWGVALAYPLFHNTSSSSDFLSHPLIGPINLLVPAIAFVVILIIAYKKELSPFEFISYNLDKKLVGMYVYPLKYKCEICGGRAFIQCDRCSRKVCPKHSGNLRTWQCSQCILQETSPS